MHVKFCRVKNPADGLSESVFEEFSHRFYVFELIRMQKKA